MLKNCCKSKISPEVEYFLEVPFHIYFQARAFLDYFGLNYDVVEVNSVLRTQVKWSKYKKVPIVVVETSDNKVGGSNLAVIVYLSLHSVSWGICTY